MVKISYLEDDEELAYSLKCLNTRYTDNLFFSFFERHFFLNLLRINKREFFLIFVFYSYTLLLVTITSLISPIVSLKKFCFTKDSKLSTECVQW